MGVGVDAVRGLSAVCGCRPGRIICISVLIRSMVISMEALVKPDRVFDRDREWAGLVRFATSSSPDVRLGIVSGRRRQGKTFLLDALADVVGVSSSPRLMRRRLSRWRVSVPLSRRMRAADGMRSGTGTRRSSDCSRWSGADWSSSTSFLI